MDEYISRETVLNLIEHNDKVCHYADERYENVVYATTQTICKVVAEIPSADIQPIDRWISIEDSLPKPYSTVILYTKYKEIAYGFFRGEYYEDKPLFSMTMSNNAENSWYEEVRITHWQPLPEPPKDGDAE